MPNKLSISPKMWSIQPKLTYLLKVWMSITVLAKIKIIKVAKMKKKIVKLYLKLFYWSELETGVYFKLKLAINSKDLSFLLQKIMDKKNTQISK